MTSRIVPLELSAGGVDTLNTAVAGLESVYEATLYGVVMSDRNGVFLHFRPGHEADVARFLASLDWSSVIRNAEESST